MDQLAIDIRHISIIDAFPIYGVEKVVLNVGCGKARLDYHAAQMGYRVYSTDVNKRVLWEDTTSLTYHHSDIFDISSFPIAQSPIVICSEVLEHLPNHTLAFHNILKLTGVRLIMTVPFKKSYNAKGPVPIGHVHHWNNFGTNGFRDIREFITLASPFLVTISKIRTKPKDVKMGKWDYLIVIDKRQCFK